MIDENITEFVILAPVVFYNITYVITEDPGGAPVDSAIVNMDGILQYTDEDGMTTFSGFLPGTYDYIILKDGFYLTTGEVEVIDEDVTIEIDLLIDALDDIKSQHFKLYPNPSNGLIHLELTVIPAQIEIFNAFGAKVFDLRTNEHHVKVDLSEAPNGIYLLNITYGEERYSQKLIKNQ